MYIKQRLGILVQNPCLGVQKSGEKEEAVSDTGEKLLKYT